MSNAGAASAMDQNESRGDEAIPVDAQRAANPTSPPLQTMSASRASNIRKRPTTAPGGPRKPTSKPSMSNLRARTTHSISADHAGPFAVPALPSAVVGQSYALSVAAREEQAAGNSGDSDAELASALPLPASPISLSDASIHSRSSSVSSAYSFGVFRANSVAARSSRRGTSASHTTDFESEAQSTSLPYLSTDPPPLSNQQSSTSTLLPETSNASQSIPPSRNPSLTAGPSRLRSSFASTNLASPISTSSVYSAMHPPSSSSASHVGTHSSPSAMKSVKAKAPDITLAPPPLPTFSVPTVTFRALPLDAAQWTFTSSELQAIVSRAIRASAEPSAIRLLPLQTLDGDMKKEEERLESEKARLQAQYRFVLQRRSMMMQALFSLAHSSPNSNQSQNQTSSSTSSPSPSPSPVPQPQNGMADVVIRLSQTAVELDTIAQGLLSVTQQLAQIRQLQDVHAGSALAVALRKLNASFARRTREIASLKEQLAAAEAERDEAWHVAEEMAFEVDEREDDDGDERTGDTIVVNVTDRAVAAPATLERASRLAGVHLRVTGVGPRVVKPQQEVDSEEQIEGEAATAATSSPPDGDSNNLARASSGSTPRTPGSRTSLRPRSNSAASRVSAARTRSQRTSKASLRIPRDFGSQRSRSRSRPREAASPSDASPRHPPLPSPISPAVALNVAMPQEPGGSGVLDSNDVPDVPKVPCTKELARMMPKGLVGEVTESTTSYTHIPIPPIPADAPGPNSFLEMSTRPNSVVEKKDKDIVTSNIFVETNERRAINSRSTVAQGNGAGLGGQHPQIEGKPGCELTGPTVSANTSVEHNVMIVSPSSISTSPTHPSIFPIQHQVEQHQILEQNTLHTDQYPSVSQHTQHRHQHPFFKPSISSLKAPNAQYRRPPPDSPVDVSGPSSTSSHGYDDEDQEENDDDYEDVDDDDAELMASFASAFGSGNGVATHVTKYGIFAGANGRRGAQTQSLLPFPVVRKGSLTRGGVAKPLAGSHQTMGKVSRGSLAHVGSSQIQHAEDYKQGMHISSSQSSPIYAANHPLRPSSLQGDMNTRRPTSLPSSNQ